jgi:hypothetical protein
LAKQGIAIAIGLFGKMSDELFNSGAGSVFQGTGATKLEGIGLDRFGIEAMAANELTQAIPDSWAAVALAIVTALRWSRLGWASARFIRQAVIQTPCSKFFD